MEEHRSSLLCPVYGAYSLQIGFTKLRVVVMSNILGGHTASQIYDLKGTTEDRWVDPSKHVVLKDNNFVPYTMVFEPELAKKLTRVIRDDAEFLEALGVMDYSLLVAISDEGNGNATIDSTLIKGWLHSEDSQRACVFRMGIIDYLQCWTPKKVAAHWIKKPTLGCCHEIDTEPPAIYCGRFFKYFTLKFQPRNNNA